MNQTALFVLLVFPVVCLLAGCENSAPTTDISTSARSDLPVIIVKRQDIINEYSVPAVVNALPDRAVKVTTSIAGKIDHVLVVPGQIVSKGSLVAQLDKRMLTAQLDQANAAIQAAAAQVQQAKGTVAAAKANAQQSLATSDSHRAAVKQAELNLAQAQENLQRQEKLFTAEVSAKKDEILARNQVEVARSQITAAEAQVHAGSGAENAARAQIAVAEGQLASAMAQLHSARASREQIMTNLSFTDVRSPIAGVVSARFLNSGDTADLNTPIAQIVNLSEVQVVATLPAGDSQKVRVGDAATIYGLAGSKLADHGIVTEISPVVDPKNNSVPVLIRCSNDGGLLKDGESVKASVVTAVDQGVVVIPRTALVPDPDAEGHFMVYVVKDNKANRTKVQLGTSRENEVEVTVGLQPGDQIIGSGAYGLPDGSAVKARG